MKKNELLRRMANSQFDRDSAADFEILRGKNSDFAWYPYHDREELESYLTISMIFKVGNSSRATPSNHTVVLSYREVDDEGIFNVWCGDAFLEADPSNPDPAYESRISDAVSQFIEEHGASESIRADLENEVKRLMGVSRPKSTPCNFWKLWRSSSNAVCKHVDSVLNSITEDTLDQLISAYQNGYSPKAESFQESEIFSIENLAFKIPILIEGDRGAGKTVKARKIGAMYDKYVELAGHESIEAVDLLGHYIPIGSDVWAWKDGPLAHAIRMASKGLKTVLVIDELLRIPQRQLSVLLTALAPTLDGKYRITIDNVKDVEDGIAQIETLECDVSNLAVIATTNIGSKYAVDEYDPALAERFWIIRAGTSVETLTRVLGEVVPKKGFSKSVIDKLILFYTRMVKLQLAGQMLEVPSTRTLCNVVNLSKSESDIPNGLRGMYLQWVARSSEGIPNSIQKENIDHLVKAIFK